MPLIIQAAQATHLRGRLRNSSASTLPVLMHQGRFPASILSVRLEMPLGAEPFSIVSSWSGHSEPIPVDEKSPTMRRAGPGKTAETGSIGATGKEVEHERIPATPHGPSSVSASSPSSRKRTRWPQNTPPGSLLPRSHRAR